MEMIRPSGWTIPSGIDSHVTEAIISACLHGSVETFEQLHDSSTRQQIPPPSYLVRCAAASNQLKMLSYVLKLYPPRRLKAENTKMDTLPYWDRISLLDQSIVSAIARGHITIVRRLMKAGMPVERYLEHGTELSVEQLLNIAIRHDQIEVACIFFERRVELNGYYHCTRTAAVHGSDDMLQLMLDYGGDIEKCDALRHMAAFRGSVQKAQRLLDFGVDINTTGPRENNYMKDDCGTALHATAISYYADESLEFAKWLLRKGIDHTIKDSDGRTALQVAQTKGARKMANLIDTWIRKHTKQEFPVRHLRSSKRHQSPLWELETSKRRKIQEERPSCG